MNHSFDTYKAISNQVLELLIKNHCSSLKDITVIYNMLMGFPYCIDGVHYIYHGELYDNMESLPIDALQQIANG